MMDADAFAALGAKMISNSSSASAAPTPPANDAFDGILKLSALKDDAKNELVEFLDSLRGSKCLMIDPQLAGVINSLLLPDGFKCLKEQGVTSLKELRSVDRNHTVAAIDSLISDIVVDITKESLDNVIFLVRPHLPMMKHIAKLVNAALKGGGRSQYHVCFAPHRTVICEQVLEDEGVLEHVTINEFHVSFVPLEKDLISLEMDALFKQCYVDGDTSSLNSVAHALVKFQSIYGTIPHIKCKGAASRKILQKMMEMKRDNEYGTSLSSTLTSPTNTTTNPSNSVNGANGPLHENEGWLPERGDIDTLVLLDRELDLVSVFTTPLIYEGLVDELFTIDLGKIRVDPSLLEEGSSSSSSSSSSPSSMLSSSSPDSSSKNSTTKKSTSSSSSSSATPAAAPTTTSSSSSATAAGGGGEKVTLYLNQSDVVYGEIRDLSIETLGSYLQEKALKIKSRYASFRDNKDASIAELSSFVKTIPNLTKEFLALHRHIHVAERLKKVTDTREFRDGWQGERGLLEGENYLDELEEMIYRDVDKSHYYQILRLLSLQSLTNGGIRTSKYEAIKRILLQTYGFEELLSLSNLEKAGILKKKDVMLMDGPSVWQGLKRQLRLIDDGSRSQDALLATVAAGYIPMLPRLIQLLVSNSNGWAAYTEILRLLPGPLLEMTQSTSSVFASNSNMNSSTSTSNSHNNNNNSSGNGENASIDNDDLRDVNSRNLSGMNSIFTNPSQDSQSVNPDGTPKRIMMVLVVGGLSYLEIAAFRMLNREPLFPYRLVLATTKIVNGNSLIRSLRHDFYSAA